MSHKLNFEISSSDSESENLNFEEKKLSLNKKMSLCVCLIVHGSVKCIVDTINCLKK